MHILVPVNKELSTMKAISFGLVTNIVFNAFLIPIYGRNGAAVGTVIGEGVVLIVGLYYANRIVRVLKMLKNIWQYIIASLPIAFICYFSKMVFNEYILQIVFSVLFSAIIYISGIIVLKNETIYILIRMIKSKYNKRR